MNRRSSAITFLTRTPCTLCDVALRRMRLPAKVLRVSIVTANVDHEPDMQERYGERVPVLLSAAGVVLAEGRISTRLAWRSVWRARRS